MSTEPKFKVGDIVVGIDGYERKILFVGKKSYFYEVNGDEWERRIHKVDDIWTLKPQEITITKEQLAKAWDNIAAKVHGAVIPSHESPIFKDLCKELGLK